MLNLRLFRQEGGYCRGPIVLKDSPSPCFGIRPSSHGKTTDQKPWAKQFLSKKQYPSAFSKASSLFKEKFLERRK